MRLLAGGWAAPTQRTIPDFRLHRPRTIAAAAAAGAAEGAVYAHGCTDLFARFREGLWCSDLVSLERIPELTGIRRDGPDLAIGAGVRHVAGAADPLVAELLPGLAAAWGSIATHRIRQRATIGGNLMARRPRYEMPIMMEALGARLETAGPVLAPADVWAGPPPGTLLHTVRIPDAAGAWFGYERALRPLMTAAVAVRGETVWLAVGSEYVRPHAAEGRLGEDPARIAARLPGAVGDAAADAGYRRHAAGVLLGRALARMEGEAR
ncbi:FAD binding domain-containing protein [Actinomadura sp. 21ATH]|uniref:FAD binding domain-containing protein n=1 Tax=Actinomadura sp. 21ATH TaxID=1735444 RepID=UPI0035BF2F46